MSEDLEKDESAEVWQFEYFHESQRSLQIVNLAIESSSDLDIRNKIMSCICRQQVALVS